MIKRFHYIYQKDAGAVYITSSQFEPLPVLLETEGLFFLWPVEMVQNAIECLADAEKSFRNQTPHVVLNLEQAIQVKQGVGKRLTNPVPKQQEL